MCFKYSGEPTLVSCEVFVRSFGSISEKAMVSFYISAYPLGKTNSPDFQKLPAKNSLPLRKGDGETHHFNCFCLIRKNIIH